MTATGRCYSVSKNEEESVRLNPYFFVALLFFEVKSSIAERDTDITCTLDPGMIGRYRLLVPCHLLERHGLGTLPPRSHHDTGHAFADVLRAGSPEPGCEQAIGSRRGATTLQMTEYRGARLETRELLELACEPERVIAEPGVDLLEFALGFLACF
jgi:hypothetical protein